MPPAAGAARGARARASAEVAARPRPRGPRRGRFGRGPRRGERRRPGRPCERSVSAGISVQTTRSSAGARAATRPRVLVGEHRQAGGHRRAAPRPRGAPRREPRRRGVVGGVEVGRRSSPTRSSRPGTVRPAPTAATRSGSSGAVEGRRRGAGQGEVAALEPAAGAQPDPLAGVLGGEQQRRPALGGGPLGQLPRPPRETRPRTRVELSRSTASFSAAISSSVSPSHSVWSRPTEVSTVTCEGIVLVASSLPPARPRSRRPLPGRRRGRGIRPRSRPRTG